MNVKQHSLPIAIASALMVSLSSTRTTHAGNGVEIRTVAVTGAPAPGTEPGVQFWLFTTGLNHDIMHPVIDEQGQLGFTGRVIGPGVDETNRNGLWAERDGAAALIIRSGEPAPGTPEGVAFSGFASDYLPFPPLAAGGRLAFDAELVGPGVSSLNGSGVWKEVAPGKVSLVARHGDPATGFGAGATFGNGVVLGGFNALHHVMLLGTAFGPGITNANNEAIWSDRAGALALVLREGVAAPGLPGLVIGHGQLGASTNAIANAMLSGTDRIFVQANLSGPGVTAFNDEALWIEHNGQMTLLVREGQPAPGAGNNVTFGGNSVSLGVFEMFINYAGQVAFTIRLGGAIPTTQVMYSTHTGSLQPVALPGDPAPGTNYDFGILANARLNSAGKLAFRAAAPDDDTDPFTPQPFAIWSDRTGALAPVVHPGDDVIGRDNAMVIGTSFIVGFSGTGQVAFKAAIEDPSVPYADALFLSDLDGVNHVVAATGDPFDVFGDGSAIRIIERIVHGGLSEDGQLAFRLDFTDQSSGHFVAKFGPLPQCLADVNGNGTVNVEDLLAVISAWGACANPNDCPADIAPAGGNDVVNVEDLLAVIGAWGACP